MRNVLNVAILGCGDIAGPYAESLIAYPQLNLLGAADSLPNRAEALVAKYGGKVYPSLDELLADKNIDAVVNLTPQNLHASMVARCLEAGKHVHTEKPLALTYQEAKALVNLAREKKLRLSCSPITLMGEAQQTAWKAIREGRLGKVRVAYAEVNWSRIENYHPNPAPFLDIGALYDVGVYPLTILTSIFGPARSVMAYGKVLMPKRTMPDGTTFEVNTPDFLVAVLELKDGTVVRLTTNFYVGWHGKQKGIEFHGDAGSVYLSSWESFNASVEFAEFDGSYQTLPYVKKPYTGVAGGLPIDWGRALAELCDALTEGRPHRASAEQAAHIVEILNAVTESYKKGYSISISSDFIQPKPMEWAL